jgi:hypothetical protein
MTTTLDLKRSQGVVGAMRAMGFEPNVARQGDALNLLKTLPDKQILFPSSPDHQPRHLKSQKGTTGKTPAQPPGDRSRPNSQNRGYHYDIRSKEGVDEYYRDDSAIQFRLGAEHRLSVKHL